MKLLKHYTIILVGLVITLQGAPTSDPDSVNQAGFTQTGQSPEEIGGHWQGDIVLPPPAIGRGVAIKPYQQWANGEVPYEFASNISASNQIFIVNQMRAMENLTRVNNTRCISFRARNSSDLYYITIYNGTGCFGPVGSWGNYIGVRPVSLLDSPTATCMITGTVQHELTHVLGFYHEQSRMDRDSYVNIIWANIDPANAYNFDKQNDSDTLMTSYDYGSVMHYGNNAFALNSSGFTIIPTQNTSAFIGQRVQLSPVDILEIQRYYGCVPTPPDPNATTSTTSTTSTSTTSTRTTTSTTTTRTTSTTSATTTTRTTSTSATTTSATTITTTSATTVTTTSATTTTATTSTSTEGNTGARNALQSALKVYVIGLISIIIF